MYQLNGYEISIDHVLEQAKTYIKNPDSIAVIERAFELAFQKHKDQLRKSGEPYIIHPIEVAYILAKWQTGPRTIASGLLHDIIEDTEITKEEIAELFDDEIAEIVDGVTKLTKLKYKSKEKQQAENHRKMLLAMSKDIRVILVKLADRLHNIRTLKFLPPEKQCSIAHETMEIYVPIAHRLGMYRVKAELEDTSLRFLKPEDFYRIAQLIKQKKHEREQQIQEMEDEITAALAEYHIPFEIKGRIKNIYSVYKKMMTREKDFEEIYDLLAIRLIVNSVPECYSALGVIHAHFKPIPNRFKDYIAMPKPNMYQSLHTTIIGPNGNIFEVQIRTKEMDEIAEQGVAAHWAYKENRQITAKQEQQEIQDKLKWYETLIAYQEEVNDAEKLMKLVKDDIFNANVYVFTPNGDVFDFPPGSTPIDFAYRIHTNLGHKTTGAIVNGKIVTLNYQLKTGDIVEIKSSRNSFGPSEDWLNIVKTSQARHKIRQYFNRTKREEYTHKGEEMFLKELASKDLSLSSIDMQKLLGAYKKQSIEKLDELYYQIGRGRLVSKTILERYFADGKEVDDTELIQQINDAAKIKEEHRKKAKNRFGIIVDGLDNVDLRIGKCCHPVPGDPIVGYITKGSGITIHHAECHNAKIDGRIVPVEWDDEHSNSFNAKIKVTALDRKNVLGDIIQKLTVINANITELNALTSNDTIIINLSLSVRNIDQLVSVVNTIKRVKDVFSVERIIQ
ncbi:RelA/SpoT family protein [Turicibacter bilis]|uniref:GTP diphosphokinase n=1 Tax=Turicibacter bilis TaxID=2735723 RepID=A0ABY5JNN9_9FIRM|nr:bifunctional (p)ppGpp synthetase/guanosine-3',5'-bis(diphosphate) 3'-pyrophosphohydrolase [Turicibacter bilis]MBS3201236.1 bifunctional (p)ppGpp synthetase/guanosine-3',5'-bis(diphosphate) 3'-pyrophosphohydrolase [Turicibacter bilis]UUF06876.1 bifunctional (p)ppGpp synthetase/guanosine-3',5'-bis(diphosphate) 3'-pyrophosphohydrolase [Turicibacter bilis]